jgi:nuclear transport factor 2 (NTF2) superfamily protein
MSVAKATTQRPPLPPFTREAAIEKVRLAEDAWNSRDPEKVAWLTQLTHAGETARNL